MRCLTPITIRLPVQDVNSKSSQVFNSVPCGKCIACLKRKRQEWICRLTEETKDKTNKSCYFVTLTYDDSCIPIVDNDDGFLFTLVKSDFQLFMKRFRKLVPICKFFAIGEYGGKTHRPHMHFICWLKDYFNPSQMDIVLSQSWKDGFHSCDVVNPARINYVTKYCITKPSDFVNQLVRLGAAPPFMLCSRGLGLNYVTVNERLQSTSNVHYYTTQQKHKVSLPRYWRSKLFEPLHDGFVTSSVPDLKRERLLSDPELFKFYNKQFNKKLIKDEQI